jgi:hypothetical protein
MTWRHTLTIASITCPVLATSAWRRTRQRYLSATSNPLHAAWRGKAASPLSLPYFIPSLALKKQHAGLPSGLMKAANFRAAAFCMPYICPYRQILMLAQEQTDMNGAALASVNVFIVFIVPITNARENAQSSTPLNSRDRSLMQTRQPGKSCFLRIKGARHAYTRGIGAVALHD